MPSKIKQNIGKMNSNDSTKEMWMLCFWVMNPDRQGWLILVIITNELIDLAWNY